MQYPKVFQNLIHHFSSLPSIGPKAAERMVLYLFKQEREKLLSFAEGLESLQTLSTCTECFNIAEGSLCYVCNDSSRNKKMIAVVEEPLDVFAFERLGTYTGIYHVLGGVLDGGKNDQYKNLHIEELVQKAPGLEEIIIATNPTAEGDLTALFLKKRLEDSRVTVTRLARGLSSGGDIEYADELTLRSALHHREEL
jgi:recombination protein RecR